MLKTFLLKKYIVAAAGEISTSVSFHHVLSRVSYELQKSLFSTFGIVKNDVF